MQSKKRTDQKKKQVNRMARGIVTEMGPKVTKIFWGMQVRKAMIENEWKTEGQIAESEKNRSKGEVVQKRGKIEWLGN